MSEKTPSTSSDIDTDGGKLEGREVGRDSKNLRGSLRLGCLSEGCGHGLARASPDSSRLLRTGAEARLWIGQIILPWKEASV